MNIPGSITAFQTAFTSTDCSIGSVFGGRHFKLQDEATVSMNQLVERFNDLYTKNQKCNNTAEKTTNKVILKDIWLQIHSLDNKANQLHEESSLITKIFTNISRFLGNLFFDRTPLVEKFNSKYKPDGAILYMSLSGNPTHLGHMAVVASAIDYLREKNIPIKEVRISLSHESYLQGKVKDHNDKLLKSNATPEQKRREFKVLIPRVQRTEILQKTINAANDLGMFKGVPVTVWNDQDQGESDHPDSYKRLLNENPSNKVYLLAGTDLADNMTWSFKTVPHAIVVTREGKAPKQEPLEEKKTTRFIVENMNYSQYNAHSSSKIQAGERLMATEELNNQFFKLKEEEIRKVLK